MDQLYGRNTIPILTEEIRLVISYFFRLIKMFFKEISLRITELCWSKLYDIKNSRQEKDSNYQLKKLAKYYRSMISLYTDEQGNDRAWLNQRTAPEFNKASTELGYTGVFKSGYRRNDYFLRRLHGLLGSIEQGLTPSAINTKETWLPLFGISYGHSQEQINEFYLYSEKWLYEKLLSWLKKMTTSNKCTLHKLNKISTFFK